MNPVLLGVALALAQPGPEIPPLPPIPAPRVVESQPIFDDGWRGTPLPPISPSSTGVATNPSPRTPGTGINFIGYLDETPGIKPILPPTQLAEPSPEPPVKTEAPAAEYKTAENKTIEITAPLLPAPAAKPAEAAAAPAAAATGDRWWIMRELQGTWLGACLDDNRMFASGWVNSSYNVSSNNISNLPLDWNDRANSFLMQQGWVRFGRSIRTDTTNPTWGFQIDLLTGSDYRFTIPRGQLNQQLMNAEGKQNIYGVDFIQHYANLYVPELFRGTEFRVGRLWTPWGVESLEAVSTPLISRSYAFNWSPPFTHCGVGAYITFDPEWSSVLMAVNGNDVYFGDPSAEWRFVGNVKWTQPGGGKNTITLAGSVGRGKFNEGDPFFPTTVSLPFEPLGRNNLNAIDLVWTHLINPRLSYNLEMIYGYQTNVPGIFNAAGGGTAHWASAAHYLFCTINPQLMSVARFETFDDFQGQRTGFEGLYLSSTVGLTWKPLKDLMLRWEARYDYNVESRPFEGKPGIFVSAVDFTIRF